MNPPTPAPPPAELTDEADLRARAALLTSINENLQGTCIYRMEYPPGGGMRCVYVSPNVERIVGIPAAALRADATAVFALIHPEDAAAFRAALAETLRTGGPGDIAVRTLLPGGDVRWMQFHSHLVERRADGTQVRDGVVVDVTAVKAAEAELRAVRQRLELALRASRTCTWDADVPSGRIVLDSAWAEMRGFPPGETATTAELLLADVPRADRARRAAAAALAIAGASDEYRVEHRVRTAAGHWMWILSHGQVTARDAHGRATRLIGTNTDISARRAAEDEVRAVNARLETLVAERTAGLARTEHELGLVWESSLEPMRLTGSDGTVRRVNEAYCRLVGQPRAALEGRPMSAPYAPEQQAELLAGHNRRFTERDYATRLERSVRLADGRPLELEISNASVIAPGQPELMLSVIHDVTERKWAGEQLRLASRLARIGYWEYDVAADRFHFNDQFYSILRTTAEREGGYEMASAHYAARFVDPADAALVGQEIGLALATADPDYERELDHRVIFADGEPGHIAVHIRVEKDAAGRTVRTRGAIVDISARKRTEEALATAQRRAEVLATASRELAEAEAPWAAARAIFGAARHLLGWDSCWLRVREEATGPWRGLGAFDTFDGEVREVPMAPTVDLQFHPVTGKAIAEGALLVHRATEPEPTVALRTFGNGRPSRTLMFVPLRHAGRTIGLLSLQSYRDGAYDAAALALAQTLADHCAGALARIQARAALGATEARFRLVWESTTDGMRLADAEGRVLAVNAAYCRLVRRERSAIEGRDFAAVYAPDERALLRQRHADRIAQREAPGHIERQVRLWDGRTIWLDVTNIFVEAEAGRPTVLGILRDITERKQAEAATQEAAALFRGVFDAGPVPILLSAVPSGEIVEVNPAALAAFGFDRAEVLGRTTDRLGLWMRPGDRGEFCRRIAAEGAVTGFETVLRTRDGTERTVLCTGTRVTIAGRTCLLKSAVDITAVRRAEAERAAIQEKLLQGQKFEALGTLAGGVAHDFNNILTGVINYTELARSDCPDTHPQIRVFLGEVLKCGQRATELVRQILLFSRSEEATRTPLALNHTVREALSLLRSATPATVEFATELDPRTPTVTGNATQIHQVVMNLGVNAAHAMRERGGRLRVRVGPAEVDAATAAAVDGLRPGPHARIEVADNGTGMPPETVARIYEPFFTTKPAGEGTGLGLAVVRSIVHAHGGGIRVRSTPGVGTVFELFFPAIAPGPAGPATPAGSAPRGNGQRILLVDDEHAIETSTRILLGRLGYAVTGLGDPAAALAHFRTRPGEFDALLCDLQMPGMNGLELVRHVRALRPELPVFLMSGFTGKLTPEQVRAEGVEDLLSKPLAPQVLAEVLARRLGRRPAAGL